MAITQLSWVTDSLGAGTIFGHASFQGGRSRAAELIANKLAAVPGMGPVLSPGDRFVGSTALDPFSTNEATYSAGGTWASLKFFTGVTATHGGTTTAFTSGAHGLANGTPVVVGGLVNTLGGAISNGTTYYVVNTATNTFGVAATVGGTALALGGSVNDTTVMVGMPHDKLPYGLGRWGSTAADILTLNNVYGVTLPCFELILVDIAGGGDLSFSVDGGAWQACGQTMTGNNGVVRFKVSQPVALNVRVRCGNASGADVVGLPGGWRPYYIDPATVTNGVIVTDYGSDGQTLHNFILTMTGGVDHATVLDSVRLGTGSPLTGSPNVTMMLHLNDVNYPTTGSGTSFSTDLTAFHTRAHPLGPILLLAWAEADPTFFDITVQATIRSTIATAAGSLPNCYSFDFYNAYANLGFTGNAACAAAGIFQGGGGADKIHPSGSTEFDVAERAVGALRTKVLTSQIGGNYRAFLNGTSYVGVSLLSGYFAGEQTSVGTGVAIGITAGTPTLHAVTRLAPSGRSIGVTAGSPTVVPGAVHPAPSGKSIAVTAGTATLHAGAVTISPSGKAIVLTPGTPGLLPGLRVLAASGKAIAVAAGTAALHATAALHPSGVAIAVGAGSPTAAPGSVHISPSGKSIALTAGTPTLVPGASHLTPSGKAIGVTAGTPTIVPGAVRIAATGRAIVIAAGSVTIQTAGTAAPAGTAIAVTAGVPTIRPGAVTLAPTGVSVAVGAGSAVVHAQARILAASGVAIAVGPGTVTFRVVAHIHPAGVPIAVTAGAGSAHTTLRIVATGATVSIVAGTPVLLGAGITRPTGVVIHVVAGAPHLVSTIPAGQPAAATVTAAADLHAQVSNVGDLTSTVA